ncbi:MAG TPA: hypothetical protein VGM92_12080 [Candidatus Kapabacteria bacterium]
MTETPEPTQRMLTMHKRTITMKDGKREMIFYTFSERPSRLESEQPKVKDKVKGK